VRIGLSYDLKGDVPACGGPDDVFEEYDSPATVDFISNTIEERGHTVVRLGGGSAFLENLRGRNVDLVFNISEGRGSFRSREAQVPSVLEMLEIPYTGSDPQCLAICLDKSVTKKLVAAEGVPTPRWLTIAAEEDLSVASWESLSYPVILKPAYEGSSKGIRLTSLADGPEQARCEALKILESYRQPVLVEEFIQGDEVTVGIIGNRPPRIVGIMRIMPRKKNGHFIYSVEVKRDYLNLVDYECPAPLDTALVEKITSDSLKIYRSLGCRDFARVDFRVSAAGVPNFIEINPLPGLGSYSDLIIMARMMGWKQEQVIGAVLDAALERHHQCARA